MTQRGFAAVDRTEPVDFFCRRVTRLRLHSPVWTLRWALRCDDFPYIFPQPAKGQPCLFSGVSVLPGVLFRDALRTGDTRLLPLSSFSFSSLPASLAPPRHLLPSAPIRSGPHFFKSSKIIATINNVPFSWFSLKLSSVLSRGRAGTQSTDASTSDISGADRGGVARVCAELLQSVEKQSKRG